MYTLFSNRVTLKASQTCLHKVPDIKQIQKQIVLALTGMGSFHAAMTMDGRTMARGRSVASVNRRCFGKLLCVGVSVGPTQKVYTLIHFHVSTLKYQFWFLINGTFRLGSTT